MSSTESLLHRCRFTPLQDLLRGAATGRLDWQRMIRESDLPASSRELIRETIRRSRLLTYEKVAVAEELIAHFQDGHRRGQPFTDLEREFGNPAVTARLIRRSKTRNRPMLLKATKVLGMGIVGITVAYLGIALYFHSGRPNPATDYLSQLQTTVRQADPSQTAWPIYRPVWTKHRFSEGGGFPHNSFLHHDDSPEPRNRLVRPGDPEWAAVVAAMPNYADLLEAFRQAADRPMLGAPLHADPRDYSAEDHEAIFPGRTPEDWAGTGNAEVDELMRDSVYGALLPHVQSLRNAARLLQVDTRIAVTQGDSERAKRNFFAMMGLAQQSASEPFLVCDLVGFAILDLCCDELEETLQANPDFFSDAELAELQARLDELDIRRWLDIHGERIAMHDMIQRVYTDDGKGNGRITPNGVRFISQWQRQLDPQLSSIQGEPVIELLRPVVTPVTLLVSASRREISQKLDELMDRVDADLAQPFWLAEHFDIDTEIKQQSEKFYLLEMLFPAVRQVRNALDRTIARREAVVAALAIHRHHREYGEWATEYEQLVPEFVAQFPVDQINGGPLKFRRDDAGITIYSVGNDRDDDGGIDGYTGEAHRFFLQTSAPDASTPDGDWILWPQAPRE